MTVLRIPYETIEKAGDFLEMEVPDRNEEDPLTCPKCSGKMKVISVIEDEDVIKRILKHLGLGEVKPRPTPKANRLEKIAAYTIDYSVSQLPAFDKWLCVDPIYPDDAYSS